MKANISAIKQKFPLSAWTYRNQPVIMIYTKMEIWRNRAEYVKNQLRSVFESCVLQCRFAVYLYIPVKTRGNLSHASANFKVMGGESCAFAPPLFVLLCSAYFQQSVVLRRSQLSGRRLEHDFSCLDTV
jgi:hypothetical protein